MSDVAQGPGEARADTSAKRDRALGGRGGGRSGSVRRKARSVSTGASVPGRGP